MKDEYILRHRDGTVTRYPHDREGINSSLAQPREKSMTQRM
jgi:hypothetical protein